MADIEVLAGGGDGVAAAIHVSLRLHQKHLGTADPGLDRQRSVTPAPDADVAPSRDFIRDTETDVVPGRFIFPTRVAKSNDAEHGSPSPAAVPGRKRPYSYFFLSASAPAFLAPSAPAAAAPSHRSAGSRRSLGASLRGGRGLFDGRRHHRHQREVLVNVDRFDTFGQLQVGDVDRVADLERTKRRPRSRSGRRSGRARTSSSRRKRLQDAALDDARRLADERQRHRRVDGLAHVDAQESRRESRGRSADSPALRE